MKTVTFEIEEALLVGLRPHADGGAGLGFKIGRDDMNSEKFEYLRTRLNRRFALVLVEIGDDEKPVIIEDKGAPEHDAEAKARRHITKLGQMHRNDPPYQQVLIEYFITKAGYEWIITRNTRDPVERRKIVASIQHQFIGVNSLAEIRPNSIESVRFDLLESLYEADKAGLPPPNMDPNKFKVISHSHGG